MNSDTAQTADIAKSSGLFGHSPAPTRQKPPAKPTRKRQTSQNAKITTNPPSADQPCDATELKTPKNTPKQPENTDSDSSSLNLLSLDLADQQSIYVAIGAVKTRTQQWHLAAMIRDRYKAAGRTDASRASQSSGSAPTKEELVSIVSAALRAENATGSDVKGLTATLQSLLPALFASDDQSKRPDPSAVVAYITGFAGRKGSEIVQELGGVEFVEARLSEVLKVSVKLADQPDSGA